MPAEQPATVDFYYAFNWCRWYSLLGCSVDGPFFQIPIHRVGGWNYNADMDREASQKQIFYMDCKSSLLGAMLRLCSENRQMSLDILCVNCYLVYDYSVFHLDLFSSGGQLGKMNVDLKASSTINIELLLKFNLIYTKSGAIPLGKYPIYGYGFTVLGYSFDLGFVLELDLPYKIELDVFGQIYTGLQYRLVTTIKVFNYGSKSSSDVSWSLKKILSNRSKSQSKTYY